MQEIMETSEVSPQLLQERMLSADLVGVLKNEEEQWRLKSRSLWLKSRDHNTKYFHNQARSKVLRNKVKEITTFNGDLVHSFDDIKKVASEHFRSLYTEEDTPDATTVLDFLQAVPNLVTDVNEENSTLCQDISKAEVIDAIWNLEPNKALGPNGFTICFTELVGI